MTGLNSSGQSSFQLIIPLILVLFLLIGFATLIPVLSTTKTLGLVAGLVIFVASFMSTDIALYILIFSMLLSPEFIVGSTGGASLGRGVTLRLDDFILLIIGFTWLAKMSINKDLGLFLRTPLNKPIAYYILACLVSTLLGALFGRVQLKTGFFFVLKYFEYMVVYFMVVNHLKNKRQVRNYLWAMLITCAIVSFIAIFQIPGGGRVSAPFEGEAGEPNTLGGYLLLMISMTIGVFLTSSSFRNRLIYGSLIILFFIPLLFTQSRSTYVAVFPAIITFLFLSEKKKFIFAAMIVIGISLPFLAPRAAKERVSFTFGQGRFRTDVVELGGVKLDTSTSARLFSWISASRDWIKHPFLGFGVTGYRFLDAQYFRVMLETGFVGLILFSILLITIFKKARQSFGLSVNNFEKGLSMGYIAGFIGLLFHGLGSNTFIIVRIMEPFWFLTAMVVMFPELDDDRVPAGNPGL